MPKMKEINWMDELWSNTCLHSLASARTKMCIRTFWNDAFSTQNSCMDVFYPVITMKFPWGYDFSILIYYPWQSGSWSTLAPNSDSVKLRLTGIFAIAIDNYYLWMLTERVLKEIRMSKFSRHAPKNGMDEKWNGLRFLLNTQWTPRKTLSNYSDGHFF